MFDDNIMEVGLLIFGNRSQQKYHSSVSNIVNKYVYNNSDFKSLIWILTLNQMVLSYYPMII